LLSIIRRWFPLPEWPVAADPLQIASEYGDGVAAVEGLEVPAAAGGCVFVVVALGPDRAAADVAQAPVDGADISAVDGAAGLNGFRGHDGSSHSTGPSFKVIGTVEQDDHEQDVESRETAPDAEAKHPVERTRADYRGQCRLSDFRGR
jgi:hypothetical protein